MAPAGFADEAQELPFHRLSRVEADAFRARHPVLSPWRVVAAQALFAVVAAVVGWLVDGVAAAASAGYGAAIVAVPGALMARGTTRRPLPLSPMVSAVGMLGWASMKLMLTVAMLALAPRIVPGLMWPVMLASMVLCLQTYWLALLWRGR